MGRELAAGLGLGPPESPCGGDAGAVLSLACLSTLIIHLEVRSFSIHLHLELIIFAITSACVLFIIGLMVGFLLGDKKRAK
jgi:hypothetical protein